MKSAALLEWLVRGSVVLCALVLVSTVIGFLNLPPNVPLTNALFALRIDQLMLIALFTLLSFKWRRDWRGGSEKGLMMLQMYAAVLIIYAVQHFNSFTASGSMVELGFSALMGVLAALGMLTYYVKYREGRRH